MTEVELNEKAEFNNAIQIIKREEDNKNIPNKFGMEKVEAICSTFRANNINYCVTIKEPNIIRYSFKNRYSTTSGSIKLVQNLKN